MIHKVGIIGHKPEDFSNVDFAKKKLGETIELLLDQYNNNLCFVIAAERGTAMWTGELLRHEEKFYHLVLPYPTEYMPPDLWFDRQADMLEDIKQSARSLTILSPQPPPAGASVDAEIAAAKAVVDEADFVVCFWSGKKQGATYTAIRHAHKTNRLVLNGLNDLKMVFRKRRSHA